MVKEKPLHACPTSMEVPAEISCHLTECPLPRYSFPQADPQSQPRAMDAIPTPWFKKKKQKPGMMRDLFKVMQPVAGVDLTFSLPTARRVLFHCSWLLPSWALMSAFFIWCYGLMLMPPPTKFITLKL